MTADNAFHFLELSSEKREPHPSLLSAVKFCYTFFGTAQPTLEYFPERDVPTQTPPCPTTLQLFAYRPSVLKYLEDIMLLTVA